MVLWVLLISMALFAITFIAFVKKPVLRYTTSTVFLILSVACSVTLMLNDTHHLGMKKTTTIETQKLVSTTGKDSALKITVYKSLGSGKEKVFVYRTAEKPNKNQKTEVDYNVTTKVEHSNTKTAQLEIKKQHYTYQNNFWKVMFAGLGLNDETQHYTYIFKVPNDWLVLSTNQLKDMKKQQAVSKKQLEAQIKEQLPALVKAKMAEALQKDPSMSAAKKAQLEKQITKEQEKVLVQKLEKQMLTKLIPQLQKESS